MKKADYIYRRGEPITLSLLAVEGDISEVISVEAVMKATGPNGSVPGVTAPVVRNFIISETEAPDVGWDLSIDAEDTEELKPGFYVMNAKLNLISGGPIKTDHILIEIRGSVV